MVGVFRKALAALCFASATLVTIGGPDARPAASAATTGAETSVPFGWVDFCARNPDECRPRSGMGETIALTGGAMKQVARVNAWVNAHVSPVSDRDHSGVVDRWDYPADGKGDCEDYALQKRRMLIDEGFPDGALLMTVVKERNGDGHSILTVRTDRGDYVLDNLTNAVKPWTSTPYRFVKRQSEQDPNVWVSVGAPVEPTLYVSR